jgi:hypothetical protein
LLALGRADAGDLNYFTEYIAKELIWSLEISIKAAKGESIEELDDIDKEIEVFKRERKNKSNAIPKSLELIEHLFDVLVIPLFLDVFEKQKKLNDLFAINQFSIQTDNSFQFEDAQKLKDIVHETLQSLKQRFLPQSHHFTSFLTELQIHSHHSNILSQPDRVFFSTKSVAIRFHTLVYEILIDNKVIFKKTYNEILLKDEIKAIADTTARVLMDSLRQG